MRVGSSSSSSSPARGSSGVVSQTNKKLLFHLQSRSKALTKHWNSLYVRDMNRDAAVADLALCSDDGACTRFHFYVGLDEYQ